MTKYLESTPFHVHVGETKTYRDNWVETFGRLVVKASDGTYVAKGETIGEWRLADRSEAAIFRGRGAAEKAVLDVAGPLALDPATLTFEPA